MMRGKLGKYLTASVEEVASSASVSASRVGVSSANTLSKVFNLSVDGQGVGDPMDCICFTNIDNK